MSAKAANFWTMNFNTAGKSGFGFGRAAPSGDAATLRRLDRLATLLDTAVAIPGTRIRFGADAAIGLLPGGDLVTAGISAYIVAEAWRMGVAKPDLLRMAGNVAFDTLLGLVPVAGDIGDVFFRANKRNVAIIREHVERRGRSSGPQTIDGEWTRLD